MGLLDASIGRTCPRQHGPLKKQEGIFGLPQFASEVELALANTLAQASLGTRISSTGKVYTVKIYSCPVCGFVELVDSDKAT